MYATLSPIKRTKNMEIIKNTNKAFLVLLFIFVANTCLAQSTETQRMLQVQDEEDTKDEQREDTSINCQKERKFTLFIYGDFGGALFMNETEGKTTSINGLSWAVSGNVNYNLLPNCCNNLKLGVSAGIEVRNYNGISSSIDRFGEKAYDNLHYWYAGVPVMLNLQSNFKCCDNSGGCSDRCSIGFYAQGGVIFGAKLFNYNYYSKQGESQNYDISNHFNDIIYQPVLSAGISCKTNCATYMAGPFATYTPNNILNRTSLEERILTYGIRFIANFNR